MQSYIKNIINEYLCKKGYSKIKYQIDIPNNIRHGDLSTNVAFILSKNLKKNPKEIATEIIHNIDKDINIIEKIEIAGAGFINFYFSDKFYKNELFRILEEKENYGKSNINENKTANVEWVSANPTKPLHAGHGRQICLGGAIANLLESSGYRVTREYYYNDAGNQMNVLAKSIKARYIQIFNSDYKFPEDGYKGNYIKEIAKKIYDEYGDKLKDSGELDLFKKYGEEYNFNSIKSTLKKLGIKHDIFYNESDLYKSGKIEDILNKFEKNSLSYEKDNALWLKMEGKENFTQDKVIVKANGEPTYRLPDMAYHIDKIERNYDLIIDIFGADHSDTYKEVLFGIKSLGYDISKINVIIHQMVTFKMGDESFKMSGRSDTSYYLDELIEDIGIDAVKFFFVMRAANTHLDFDIRLAKEQSEKNPVYYLQYAHARICGILLNLKEYFSDFSGEDFSKINMELIRNRDEISLLKCLSRYPRELEYAYVNLEPHKIITYLNEVAENFHKFYHNNRILDLKNPDLSFARLIICVATKQILKNGFDIIGIKAPERM